MFKSNRLWIASGIGLVLAILCVAAQRVVRDTTGNQLYWGTGTIVAFAYLFLTSSAKEEGDSLLKKSNPSDDVGMFRAHFQREFRKRRIPHCVI